MRIGAGEPGGGHQWQQQHLACKQGQTSGIFGVARACKPNAACTDHSNRLTYQF
jgi:hypothetical protein